MPINSIMLGREFYNRDGLTVARELIGKYLVHELPQGRVASRIVETEGYMGESDRAAHSYKRKSERTSVLYQEGGYAYIYLIYGMYHCFNISANVEGIPECVLIRAVEPIEGINIMREKRKINNVKNLTNGPGKLCRAMGIDMGLYGEDMC